VKGGRSSPEIGRTGAVARRVSIGAVQHVLQTNKQHGQRYCMVSVELESTKERNEELKEFVSWAGDDFMIKRQTPPTFLVRLTTPKTSIR
jgi:hypothetical protein